jgi:endonuclease/exonuclease/phosphatase family metal-dependent hydrolase
MDLDIAYNKATFPSFRPKYMLDLFLTSKNIDFDYKIVNTNISDHLPVILEIG